MISVNNKLLVTTDTDWYNYGADRCISEPPVTIAINHIIQGVICGSDRPSVTTDPDHAITTGSHNAVN